MTDLLFVTNKIKCGQNPLKIKDVNKNKFVDIFFWKYEVQYKLNI